MERVAQLGVLVGFGGLLGCPAEDRSPFAADSDTAEDPADPEDTPPAPSIPADPSTSTTSGGTTSAPPPAEDDGEEIIYDLLAVPDAPPVPDECAQDVDIVFVMDVSTTMGTFLDTLAEQILSVDAGLAKFDLPSEPHYGLVVFVDDAEIINGGAAYTDAEQLKADFEMWSSFTSSNQQVGGGNSNSTWPENSLDALYLAADAFDWRPAATTTRLVIHTTDDTFWEGPATHNGVMITHDYPETVAALQDETVRVFAFADTIGGSCVCEDVSPGWFEDYMGQVSIPEATDGGIFDINDVLSGLVSIAQAITESVEQSYCQPYNPVG